MGNKKDIDAMVSDLMYIKNAISKNNNIFKFINLNEILRKIYLIGALVIIGFSGLFYYFIEKYGSYNEIPINNKVLLYSLISIATIMVGGLKVAAIMKAAKKINRNMTVFNLLKEVYSTQFILIVIPYFIALIFVPVFLENNDLSYYIVPFLSIFIGLLCNSLVSVFYIRELIVLGSWLVATGLIILLGLITLHPLLITMLTFGLGFIIIYIFSFFTSDSEKEC